MEYGGVDPLKEACTIAKACSLVYRKQFMPEKTLAVISPQTTNFVNRQYSVKALRWLHYLCDKEDKWIQHARNGGGEKTIGSYSVDGWDLENPHIVYEFNGCLFHGCPVCYPERNTKNPFLQRTMEDLYQTTCQRRLKLEQQGYQVVEMWEHEYEHRLKTDPEFKHIVDSYQLMDPLNPRDSLYGGRTNATCLLYEADEEKGEEIKYLDVCSLYPYVCKYCRFPTGHPRLLTEHIDLNRIRQYEGLIKCKVLPPKDLYHPVLPHHCQGKLMFPLCRTCAETCNQDQPCYHTQEERALTGTWVSVELFKALDMGYQLLEVYEICHFSKTQQYHKGDPSQKGIFADYVDAFLKLKQEASGYPSWCHTPEDQQKFKEKYREQEGITLDHIEKNEGRRSFAKVMLNCLWGKMAQRPCLPKTEYLTEPSQYFEMIHDKTKYMKHVDVVREDLILVNYEEDLNFVQGDEFGNVIIAAYVTAHARLKLYEALELLGDRVLYFDTDSCIYIDRPGQPHPVIEGDRLGAWTDEHPENKILSFASGGPKNYGYQYRDTEGQVHTECKVKGLTLNYRTSQVVNFDVLKKAIQSGEDEHFQVTTYQPNKIVRLPTHHIVSRPLKKLYQIVYQKRVRLPNHFTLPYGHVGIGLYIKRDIDQNQ
jgi:hypothetical protein